MLYGKTLSGFIKTPFSIHPFETVIHSIRRIGNGYSNVLFFLKKLKVKLIRLALLRVCGSLIALGTVSIISSLLQNIIFNMMFETLKINMK